ncbi:MAG TPA: hypothetical protein VES58_05945 [Syntrophobacteria bacterium]|nr:hypothetical protein [Syntrophobacteria bacterium]
MALVEINYEEYMKKLDQAEKRYRSDEPGFPEGAREKGLEIIHRFRREVAEIGPANLLFYVDTLYDLALYKPKNIEA